MREKILEPIIKAEPQRVAVYIDGFNLYYGIKSLKQARLKWLDVYRLAQSFIRSDMDLVSVNYFTAKIKGLKQNAIQRQQIYLKALEVNSPKLSIQYGRFLPKDSKCQICNGRTKKFEEKRTDVNIACSMLSDTYENKVDTIILVSGDSDLYTPIEIAKSQKKYVIVAMPPNRKSSDLKKIANGHFHINETMLEKSLLAETIVGPKGNKIKHPSEWA